MKTPGNIVKVLDLKADYIERPLGLESAQPRLSWRLESSARNVRQSAYRIRVASSAEALSAGGADLWDSCKIESGKSFGIRYQGRALPSRQRCWWCVQVWDQQGEASPISEISWWEMGLLDPQDWSAQWLAVEDPVARADRLSASLRWIWGSGNDHRVSRKFRCKFHVPSGAHSGALFAASYDWYAKILGVWIDGKLVAGPEWERAWVKRLAIDLQPLSPGEHSIAVEVKTASAFPPGLERVRIDGLVLFARLHLQNGEALRIGSGPEWKTHLTQDEGWNTPEYDDGAWESATLAPLNDYQPWPLRPAMHLRRLFSVSREIVSARLYATALGGYEARLNGERVGNEYLAPEISQYAKRVQYRVFDVTAMLKTGANALGLTVGDGWYASFDGRFAWGSPPRRVLAQLELAFADGSREVIATGPGWRTAESPIRTSEMRVGEVYDARLEQPGWDTANFDDSHWQAAQPAEIPPCRVVAQLCPPIRATQTIRPRTITQPRPGVYVFDLGQHFAGWCRLHVQGPRGTRIELKFAELLTETGEVDLSFASMGEPKVDVFILRGAKSPETFEPHFTYRGFRYVQAEGLPEPPTLESLEGRFVHSDLAITGELRVGNPIIQTIWRNTLQSQRSNFVSIPTDCPSREQRAWMGDVGLLWAAAAFNMDVHALATRQMNHMRDDQLDDGAFPTGAPEPRHNIGLMCVDGTSPVWGDAGIVLPWTTWKVYGDLGIVEENWEAMNRHVQFISNANPDHIWRNQRNLDLGDWLALDQTSAPNNAPTTPRELVATAYWAYSAHLLAVMADATGRVPDAKRLHEMFERVRRAFNAAYVKPDGTVGDGSQTCQVLALRFGLLPEALINPAAERLAADVRSRGVSLTTGIVGTRFILDVLTDAGFADLAYGLLLRSEFPSWGHMIDNGATTIWENWSGVFANGDRLSRNHFVLGSICAFLFRRVAGIDAATPGFETIVIRPALDPRVKRGGGDYDSVMGRISTDWEQLSDGGFKLDVTLPANTTARIHLPTRPTSRIEESGQEISRLEDIQILARLDHEAVIAVGSGVYRFTVTAC